MPPIVTLRAFLQRVGDMRLDLLDRLLVDERSLRHAGRRPVADLELGDGVRELRDEGVVNAGLRIDAVGADAGLAHVAEFGDDRALDRGVDMGVVEHDERRVAAELEPDLLHRSRRLAHEQLADLGRAGEADEAHGRMFAHRLADRGRIAGQQIEDAGGHAGAQREFAERERRQRRLGRGLRDHRAADGERRRDLAGDHRGGKVPWGDRRDHADRLPDDDDARIGAEGRVDLAVDALGLLAEEFDVGGGVIDLAARLGERLPLLARHDERDVLAVHDDEIEPAAQDLGALFRQGLRPRAEGARRRLYRADCVGMAEARDLGDERASRRIIDRVDALADPFAVDEALVLEQRGIGEFHQRPPAFEAL